MVTLSKSITMWASKLLKLGQIVCQVSGTDSQVVLLFSLFSSALSRQCVTKCKNQANRCSTASNIRWCHKQMKSEQESSETVTDRKMHGALCCLSNYRKQCGEPSGSWGYKEVQPAQRQGPEHRV